MKNIKLSKKDKSFIEKLAMKLFPKYRYDKKTLYGGIYFHHNNTSDLRLFGFKSDGSDSDTYETANFTIHWYEFCINYVIKALYEYNEKKLTNKQKGITYNDLLLAFISCEKPIHLLKFWYKIIIENKPVWKELKLN